MQKGLQDLFLSNPIVTIFQGSIHVHPDFLSLPWTISVLRSVYERTWYHASVMQSSNMLVFPKCITVKKMNFDKKFPESTF